MVHQQRDARSDEAEGLKMTDDVIKRARRLVELYPKAVDGTLTYDQQQKYDKLMYGYGRVDEARALLAEREAREKAEARVRELETLAPDGPKVEPIERAGADQKSDG